MFFPLDNPPPSRLSHPIRVAVHFSHFPAILASLHVTHHRFHLLEPRFLKQLEESNMAKAQLGLAHSYSRAKVSLCQLNQADDVAKLPVSLLTGMQHPISSGYSPAYHPFPPSGFPRNPCPLLYSSLSSPFSSTMNLKFMADVPMQGLHLHKPHLNSWRRATWLRPSSVLLAPAFVPGFACWTLREGLHMSLLLSGMQCVFPLIHTLPPLPHKRTTQTPSWSNPPIFTCNPAHLTSMSQRRASCKPSLVLL